MSAHMIYAAALPKSICGADLLHLSLGWAALFSPHTLLG